MHPLSLKDAPAFQALQMHYVHAKHWQLRELFARNPARFTEFSVAAAGLFFDYSKNRLDESTLRLLCALARERGVEVQRDAMFAGEKINTTEDRPALHTVLRAPLNAALQINGQSVSQDVHAVLQRMKLFTQRLRQGEWRGASGQPITDIVTIGIGGSNLGPMMVCHALRPFALPGLKFHFVANVDGHALDAVFSDIKPETTLFIVASKTFTTAETMMNAHTARAWFLQRYSPTEISKHFVAVSTHAEAVAAFGIDPANMFPFWDWVGGRYSIWSAIGLPVALAVGFERFADFLAGAYAMDRHFCEAPLEQNMPVLLALIGVWYRNFFGSTSISIAPYHQDLSAFPAYLQQLDMESNGKRVARDGTSVTVATAPVVWGDVGTNGQHAYFQLLHQGTDLIPVDFIAAIQSQHGAPTHHAALLANCLAQAEALLRGKTAAEIQEDQAIQVSNDMVPHKTFPGNRPSNMILMDALTPATLGALIALYEHKVFVQGVLWGVNSFDQWGVELGKGLATTIFAELLGNAKVGVHDGSTAGLIARIKVAL